MKIKITALSLLAMAMLLLSGVAMADVHPSKNKRQCIKLSNQHCYVGEPKPITTSD